MTYSLGCVLLGKLLREVVHQTFVVDNTDAALAVFHPFEKNTSYMWLEVVMLVGHAEVVVDAAPQARARTARARRRQSHINRLRDRIERHSRQYLRWVELFHDSID